MSAVGTTTTGGRSRPLILTAMIFAVAMTFIDQTIVSIAAPKIQADLGLTSSGMQWAINAYLLTMAALFAFGGRLADTAGHRRMAVLGVIAFAAASALCGLTPSGAAAEGWLVTFRAVQGASGAIMFPAALAIVVETFEVRSRGRALALFFGIAGGLTAVDPIAGGYLLEWTWRSIFWINVPIALIALVLIAISRPANEFRSARMDVRGLVLIVAVERRTESPLVNVRIFADRAFTVDNVILAIAMMVFIPVFFFASIYGQVALAEKPTKASLLILWFFLGYVACAQIGGRMLDRGGARRPVLLGCVLAAAGFFLWAGKATDLNAGAQTWYIVLAGAGLGFLLGQANTDAVNHASRYSYGEATGITQTVRNYGASLGFAVPRTPPPARSENPSAVTAKTPKNGREITAESARFDLAQP